MIETRPSTTSGGLAGNIKRQLFFGLCLHKLTISTELHLFEYKKRHLEYLEFYRLRGPTPLQPVALQSFSEPYNAKGYDDQSITDDMITEILLGYHEKTRGGESAEYMSTLTGKPSFAYFRNDSMANTLL